MRLRQILLGVLGVVLLAAIVGAVVLATMDFGRFKGPLAAQVERATGRALIFDGEVSLRLLPRPRLRMTDVALANAPWGSQPHMLRVGTLEAELELRPLIFDRALHITRLVLRDASLLLETDEGGRRNWDLGGADGPETVGPESGTPEGGVRTDAAGLPLIDSIVLGNIAITWQAHGGDRHAVALRDLTLSTRPDGRLALSANAGFRDQAIGVVGDLDLPTGFQAPGGPFVANLALTLPGTVAKLSGGLGNAHAGSGLDLSIQAEAEPAAALNELLGFALPAAKAHLSARIQGELAGTMRAAEFALRLGSSDLAGTASLDRAGARPRIAAELESTRLDLAELLPAAAPPSAAPGAAPGAAPTGPGPGASRLFADTPLDLAALRHADADIALRIASLATPTVALDEVVLRLVLADGDLALRPYGFTLLGSHVAGDARLNAAATPPAFALDLAGQQLDLPRLLALAGMPRIVAAKGDLVLALRGRGATPHAMAASAEGNASLVVGQGMLHASYLDQLGLGPLRQAVPQLQRLEESRLNCAIARFDIARGVATAKLLAADAGDISLIGNGTVNLGTEALALDLAPRVKIAGLGGLVVPVQVRGTLLAPAVAVLGRPAARGNPLAALGGIVLDPGASRTNPCGGLGDTRPASPAPTPAPAPGPGTPRLPNMGDVLRLLPR